MIQGSDATEYMFHPSGCFMGSELERALEHNTAVTSIGVSSENQLNAGRRGELGRHWTWPSLGRAQLEANEASTRTLRALRGCKLPLSLTCGM